MLSLTAEGRRAWHFFEEVDQIYEKLLSGQSQDYEGELSFFAIHPLYRGLGISKGIIPPLLQLYEQRKHSAFLCVYRHHLQFWFYERQNMLRCGTEEVKLQVNKKPEKFLFLSMKMRCRSIAQKINKTENIRKFVMG